LRHFNFSSAALYKLGINLRRLGAPEEQVREVQRVIFEEIINPLKKDLANETARFEQQFGNPKLEAKFTKPLKGTFEIQYPRARLLLELLVDFDKLLFRVHQLWHAMLIEDDEYLRVTDGFRNRLKESEKRIDHIVREALQLARKQQEDAAVEASLSSMAAAGPLETTESAPRPAGRKGRKFADAAPAPETPGPDQEKGPEPPPMDSIEGAAFSPFEQIQ